MYQVRNEIFHEMTSKTYFFLNLTSVISFQNCDYGGSTKNFNENLKLRYFVSQRSAIYWVLLVDKHSFKESCEHYSGNFIRGGDDPLNYVSKLVECSSGDLYQNIMARIFIISRVRKTQPQTRYQDYQTMGIKRLYMSQRIKRKRYRNSSVLKKCQRVSFLYLSNTYTAISGNTPS